MVGGFGGEEGGGNSQIMSQKKRASPTRYATHMSEEELKYKSVQNHIIQVNRNTVYESCGAHTTLRTLSCLLTCISDFARDISCFLVDLGSVPSRRFNICFSSSF